MNPRFDDTVSEGHGRPNDFVAFYQATLSPLRSYLSKLLGDHREAEDIAQNAFMRIQPSLDEGRAREPRLLLFTIARRLALNELRRRRTRNVDHSASVAMDSLLSADPSVERVVAARLDLARFEEMLLTIPPGCRQVFLLRKVENLRHEQIADRLGISTKTVENHMTRAYRLLREAYESGENPSKDKIAR